MKISSLITRIISFFSLVLFAGNAYAVSPCDQKYEANIRVNLADERIDESSGLIASHKFPGLLWTHNDSGDVGRVFGISTDGETRAIATLKQKDKIFEPFDVEDIAFGPCKQASTGCIYLADIGDNDEIRPSVFVYSFQEPELGETDISFEMTQITYPDGAHNVEALLIDPQSMNDHGPTGYFIEKTNGPARVWKAQLNGKQSIAKEVATIPKEKAGILGSRITGADVSPDGKYIALRTYNSITLLCQEKQKGRVNFVSLFNSKKLVSIIPPDSVQSESVAIGLEGELWYTSENTPTPLVSLQSKKRTPRSSCRCSSTKGSTDFFLILVGLMGVVIFGRKKFLRV